MAKERKPRSKSVLVVSIITTAIAMLSLMLLFNPNWVGRFTGFENRMIGPLTAMICLFLSISQIVRSSKQTKKAANLLPDIITFISAGLALAILFHWGSSAQAQILDFLIKVTASKSLLHRLLISEAAVILVLLYSLGYLVERVTVTKWVKLKAISALAYSIMMFITVISVFSYVVDFPLLSNAGTKSLSIFATILFFNLSLAALLNIDMKSYLQMFGNNPESSTVSGGSQQRLISPRVFLGFVLVATFLFAVYERFDSADNKKQVIAELTGISEMKVNQINAFVKERLADAKTMREDDLLSAIVVTFLENPQNESGKKIILQRLESIRANYGYCTVALYDSRGNLRLISSHSDEEAWMSDDPDFRKAIAQNKIILTDLFKEEQTHLHDKGNVHLRLWVPVNNPSGNKQEVAGLWMIEQNAETNLTPIINSWSIPSKTAETVMFRKDGNLITYLSELRFMPNTALNLSFPIKSHSDEVTVQALAGVTRSNNCVIGLDYRERAVIGIANAIPETNWIILNKIDLAEVYAPFNRKARLSGAILIVLFICSALLIEINYRRKIAVQSTQASGEWQATFNAIGDAVILVDSNFSIIRANSAVQEILGIDSASFLGQDAKVLLSDISDGSYNISEISNNHKTRGTARIHYNDKWLHVSADQIPESTGNRKGMVITMRDVSDVVEAESAILQSELKFRNIFENSPVGKSITTPDGKLNVNASFASMLGYTQEELISNWQSISHPEDVQETQNVVNELLAGKKLRARFKKRYLHKDGSTVWADVSTFLQRDAEGKPDYFITTVSDISKEIKFQEQLQETNQYLESLIRYANAPIIVWDTDYIITRYNPAFALLTGISCEEIKGKPISILFPAHKVEQYMELIRKTSGGKRWETEEIEILSANGETHTLLWSSATLYDADDITPIATIAQGSDISKRIAAEQEVKELNETLEKKVIERTALLDASNKELEAFSYSVSHDLRAPLRHISGYIELFNSKFRADMTEKGIHYIDSILESAQSMGKLIDDLLAFSRSGKEVLNLKTFAMDAAIQDVLVSIDNEISDKHIEWKIGALPNVRGDEDMIKLVWTNLILNAVKFTKEQKLPTI